MPSIQVPSTSAEIASDAPARLTYAFLQFGGYVRNQQATRAKASERVGKPRVKPILFQVRPPNSFSL